MNNLTRRSLLKAKFSRPLEAIRMPWVKSEFEFTEGCSRCYDCISNCSEKILIKGDGGFPELNFDKGECTFCSECVKSCSEDLFFSPDQNPWSLKAEITDDCFANKKVVCVVCKEQCETEAIKFNPKLGGIMEPEIIPNLCTGCGACAKPCPTNAIKFSYSDKYEQ